MEFSAKTDEEASAKAIKKWEADPESFHVEDGDPEIGMEEA